ncbi:hypothetical protein IFM89_022815 [Coptis chinensis]|uniref:Cyclin N-terminal domain-containing protein n=1 Tax=Coptis chinensis TaxID=261450 RepID=A0A835HPB6_9MAGN|nr:hypothetical protein IFM89_022815 [Coptis chinensis]
MMQLLAVACLSLAAKIEEIKQMYLFLYIYRLFVSKFVFEARTIQRMELHVLSTLNWRMQAIIPFSFIDYFLWKFNDDQPPWRSLIARSINIILTTLRPSEVAAASSGEVVEVYSYPRCFIDWWSY